MTFEQGFQLKIRGNTKEQGNRQNLQYVYFCQKKHTERQKKKIFRVASVEVEFVSSFIPDFNKTRMYLLMKKNNFYIDIIPVLV